MATGSCSCVSLGKLPSLSGPLARDGAGQSTLPGPLSSGELRSTAGEGSNSPSPTGGPLPPRAEASAIPPDVCNQATSGPWRGQPSHMQYFLWLLMGIIDPRLDIPRCPSPVSILPAYAFWVQLL